jgi:pimeloyl-ACP methyl ester carboxylesterase
MKALIDSILTKSTDVAPNWFRQAIEAAPERSRVAVEGAEIEVLAWGERGRPGLLLLHGFRSHADWWSRLAPMLAEGRRVCALSWSGMGRSGWRKHYNLELYAREAMVVAEATGLFEAEDAPVVVGHSLGGHVAAIISVLNGARLKRVMLVDSTVGPRPPTPPPDAERRVYPSVQAAIERFRFTPAQPAAPYILDWIARNALVLSPDDDKPGWVWSFDPAISGKLTRTFAWPLVPQARCPLDFIRGAQSKIVPPALEDRQRAHAAPGTRFVSIPEAGHHILADQPLALISTIRALLA